MADHSIPITKRQQRVVAAIRTYVAVHDVPPTTRELCDMLQMTNNGVHGHLLRLRNRGLVTWAPKLGRTIQLTPAAKSLPLVTLEALSK